MTTQANTRDVLTSLLLGLSFLTACGYYGVGANLVVLLTSTGCLLLALAVLGPTRLAVTLRAKDWGVWLSLWVLLVLVVSHLYFSISPENSYAASWPLASIPLFYLAYRSLGVRRWLAGGVVCCVVAFAIVSVVRFLVTGQRAYEPLNDPNGYATLLYLVWIPFAHRLLLTAWSGAGSWTRWHVAGYAVCAVVALALFATYSRAGTLMIAGALAGWLALALRRRLDLKPWLALAACAGVALAVQMALSDQLTGKLSIDSISRGVDVRGAMNEAGWQMFLERPLTGTGVFTFVLRYPLYRHVGDQSTAGMFAHNDYLQLAVETGPWLLLALAVVAAGAVRRLFSAIVRVDDEGLARFGPAMAVTAVLVHAAVNFTFYVLPVGILFAIVCAEAFDPPRRVAPAPDSAATLDRSGGPAPPTLSGAAGWAAAAALALIGWLYLALDTATQVVFADQPGPSYLRDMRKDPARLLEFARLAQKAGSVRATPVLGEALALTALSGYRQGLANLEILRLYRRALRLDAYAAFGYWQFYDFIKRARDPEVLRALEPDEAPDRLLLRAVQLDVAKAGQIFELLGLYDRLGEADRGLIVLKTEVFPWLEFVQWQNTEAARQLANEMRRRALEAGDQAFADTVAARYAEIRHIRPFPAPDVWLQKWQGRTLNDGRVPDQLGAGVPRIPSSSDVSFLNPRKT